MSIKLRPRASRGKEPLEKGMGPHLVAQFLSQPFLFVVGFLVNYKLQELRLVYHKRSRWGLQHKQLEV